MPRLVYDGKEIPVPKEGELVLGRHRDNALQISDGKASRRHTRVFCKADGTIWAEDLDSANGTFINEDEIFNPHKLVDGDLIIIGKAKIRFLGDTVETTPANGVTVIQADPKELIDKLIGGCRLTAIIGSGHHGTVYKAKQLSLNREVAVKVFSADFLKRDPQFAERFLQECRQAGRVHHHNVVNIHECGNDDGMLWYSMELVEGDIIEDLLTRDGRMDPMLACIIFEQAASALQAAHATKMMHGDVHPGTLMLSNEGKLKLLDLGLVRVLNSGRTSGGKKRVIGNPWYMSPERAKGGDGDERSDIYSLGCVFYHMLTGEPPYDDDSPKAILKAQLENPIPNVVDKVATLPKAVDEMLHSMLSKNPEWRFATIEEVLTELRGVREQLAKMPSAKTALTNGGAKGKKTLSPNGNGADHAALAAINLERAQVRSERDKHSQYKRLLIIVSVLVFIGIAYVFSGVSITQLIDRSQEAGRGIADPFDDDVRTTTTTTTVGNKPTVIETNQTPVATVDELAPRWKSVQLEIDAHAQRGNWGAAELSLNRFIQDSKNAPSGKDYMQGVALKRNQLQLDGEAWYRKQIAALPLATEATQVAPRLARLGELRDVTLSSNRSDAESRYQELVTKLDQQLRAARRQARQAVEEGKLAELPNLAKNLAPWFSGTPVAGVYRQFAALTQEAVGAKPLWQNQWQATREHLRTAKGEQALAAGAALMLAGYADEGKAVLLAESALNSGVLVRRREALFGREAAILSFSDLGDLQYIETLQGDIRLVDGALSGVGREISGVAVAVPVGGANWNAAMTITLGKGNGQALISCVKAEVSEFSLRIETNKLALKVHSAQGWENIDPPRPTGPLLIRLTSRANKLQVLVNNVVVCDIKDARIPSGSQLRIECADIEWKLDEVQVVGE